MIKINKMEVFATPCRNRNKGNFYLVRLLQTKMILFWQKCLVKVVQMPRVETNLINNG